MGGTGRERFASSTWGLDAQYSEEYTNAEIKMTTKCWSGWNHTRQEQKFIDVGVCTGQARRVGCHKKNGWWCGTTKWQPECESSRHGPLKSHPTEITPIQCSRHRLSRHKSRIEQWIADGCIAVIGHCCQDKAFSISKTTKEKTSASTQPEREMLFLDAKKFTSILGVIAVE